MLGDSIMNHYYDEMLSYFKVLFICQKQMLKCGFPGHN